MAIKKFQSMEDAVRAGFTISLGNDEYAEGGEEVSRDRYPHMTAALFALPEKEQRVLDALADSGGVVLPWMRNVISISRLREIWKSGDWIR